MLLPESVKIAVKISDALGELELVMLCQTSGPSLYSVL